MGKLGGQALATAEPGADAGRQYSGPSDRDQRIDILRGGAILLLGIELVMQVVGFGSNRPFESTGTVSALGLIIVTEGALIGMHYRPRLASGAVGEIMLRLWRRSRGWYLAAVGATLGTLALRLLPAVNTGPITEVARGGDRPSLFAPAVLDSADVALSYPVNPNVVLDIALLRLGPWPFDVVGVLCVLFVLSPIALVALGRGRWHLLLAVSAALWLVEIFTQVRILPTRAESSLPILGWQFVFVAGMTAGYYRRELVQWFRTRSGIVAFAILSVAAIGWLVLPLIVSPGSTDLLDDFAGPQSGWLFEPSAPGPLRIAIALVMVVVSYGALTGFWRPLSLAVGWLLVPLGTNILRSLVSLIVAALVIVSVPALRESALPPAVTTAIALACVWGAIRIIDIAIRKASS